MNPKDQIKQSLSILDVVSTYVRLEKSGSQYKGRCPFHNEKSPSFFVSPDRGNYHCFGCNEHGDIFSFIEKIESVPFYEALSILADRAGIKLSPYKKEEKDKESNLISLLQKATNHFEKNLENSPLAKSYLGSRALLPETIKKFNIGFSLGGESSWRDLFIDLSKNGFSPEEMISAGVVIKKEGEEKYFDRFRGRIMFPIKNSLGNVVGFSARILPEFDDGKAGKYINSPETDVYHKSKILFGYDLAKRSIAEKKEVVLVEGQMDLIMSHQAGIQNVVAVSGTSLTEEHVKILKRFADKVLLSFDQDIAGETAMKRSALLALYGGLDVFIVPKKEGVKDTADLIKEFGGEAWKELVDKRVHLIEYLLSSLFEKIKDERERLKIARTEILPFLRAIESDMDKAYFIRFLAGKLNIEEIDIYNDLKKIKNINSEEFFAKKEDVKNEENILSKKDLILKEILAITKFKNIDLEKMSAKYFEPLGIIDYKKIFGDEKENFPEEIIEKEISKLEDKISNNNLYIEDEKVFINETLRDLTNNYKIELLEEEAKKLRVLSEKDTEENLIRVSDLRKEIHKLKTK
ncbi:MAG: primase [Patescibacteria group bacterium]|nr:primase [Patescibacteria group bacterium]